MQFELQSTTYDEFCERFFCIFRIIYQLHQKERAMNPKNGLFLPVFLLTFFISDAFAQAQRNAPIAVNDTVNITPFIPVTVNILANDTIAAGDSIKIIFFGGGLSYIFSTIDTGGNVTFEEKHWGNSEFQYLYYQVRDYTNGTISDTATILFINHDQSFGYLDINNVRARFNSSGLHFFHHDAEYEVPKGSGKTTIFANSIWVGGYDSGNLLHFAGERYRQGPTNSASWTKQDYRAGPVSDSTAYTIYQDTVWNYVWKVNRSEVDYHRTHFWYQGYVAPYNILTWPGNGNVAFGQASKLAPFSDRNGDGIYEPYDGDYPEIRGDQALFFIYNDDHGFHLESWGEKLKVEVHGMAYAFDRPNDTAFKNTVFLHCKVINRSQNTYNRTFFGIFTDLDIGYANDDYIGSDPERGMYYGYNGDSVDGTGQSNAYGSNPPMQAVVILGGPVMDPDGYDNPAFRGPNIAGPSFKGSCDIVAFDSTTISMKYGPGEIYEASFTVRAEAINGMNFGDGIIDNERYGMSRFFALFNLPGFPTFGNPYPAYAREYYLTMDGLWSDSTKMVYGGAGHSGGGGYGPECNFMYPGLSDTCDWGTKGQPPNGPKNWSEETGGSYPNDIKGASSCGPFTFGPGDIEELDLAFVWMRDYQSMDSTLAKLNAAVDTIRRHFRDNLAPGGGVFYSLQDRGRENPVRLKIYPNPAKDMIFVEIPGQTTGGVEISIISSLGTIVYSNTIPCQPVFRIGLKNVPAGFYLLKVKSGLTVLQGKVIVSQE